MEITRHQSKQRASSAVIHNNTIYLAGQVAADPSQGVQEQTANVLEKIDTLLQDLGSHRDKILSATIYLKDIAQFQQMNEIWDNWVNEGHAPARACVEAKMARDTLLVEICVIAAL